MEKRNWQKYRRVPQDKISLGIACCRFNKGKPEMLLVCKRYTYAYNLFTHGKYNSNNSSDLICLFNGMTVDEKLDLLSLNFTQIWYRIWLNMPRNANYYLAKNKFESTFLIDGGSKLRKLISKSTNSPRIWEIPKGRKRNKSEPDIQCATREFYEETGVNKKSYIVFPDEQRTFSYVDGGVRYTNTYFLALAKNNIEPRINFALQDQIDEISDIRWMSIDDIKYIDTTQRLTRFIRPIFNYMKKYNKNKQNQLLI